MRVAAMVDGALRALQDDGALKALPGLLSQGCIR
jgi:hypothetical protein